MPISGRVREILESTPELAVCGKGCLDRIARFADALSIWGARINLTADPGNPAEVAFHVIDSLAPLFVHPGLLRDSVRVLDLGSGAGFPGLMLAAAIDAEFTLIEARRKRASFLSAAATEMGLTNVQVVCKRATPESVGTDFDVMTSRAVGAASLEIAGKALRPGGVAILWITPEQQVDSSLYGAAGLGEPTRHEYTVKRGTGAVRRSLIILHKSF